MTRFEIGKTYYCRSVCDYDCIWEFEVAKRTAQTITTACGKTLRFNKTLSEYNQAETVFPQGRYSMAPILTADNLK